MIITISTGNADISNQVATFLMVLRKTDTAAYLRIVSNKTKPKTRVSVACRRILPIREYLIFLQL